MNTIAEMNRDDLMSYIYNVYPTIQEYDKYLSPYEYLLNEQRFIPVNNLHKHFRPIDIAISMLAGVLLSLAVYILYFLFLLDYISLGYMIIVYIISCFLILLIFEVSANSKYKKAETDIMKRKEYYRNQDLKKTQLYSAMYNILDQHLEIGLIPDVYRRTEVLNFVFSYLQNFRAYNWTEAINLYEFEKKNKQTALSTNNNGSPKGLAVRCNRCGSTNCQIINEIHSSGKDFSASKGCCGWILLGPLGILCGSCGEGKQINNIQYWVCNDCGNKWRHNG